MLILKSIFSNKSILIVLLAITIIGFVWYKYTSLLNIIEEKDDIISIRNKTIVDLNQTITIEKLTNETNKRNMESLRQELTIQNNKVKELKVDNDKISKIIEDHKKEKPSTKVITKTINPKYTKYKGVKYEDL